MKIFITGATGYIGSMIAKKAAEKGYTVHALVRNAHAFKLPQHKSIIPFNGDVTDGPSVAAAMSGCNYVIHAAAIAKLSVKNNADFFKINVEGTRNILKTACSGGIKKLIFTSSASVLGPSFDFEPLRENDPRITSFNNDYELSKYMAEELVKEYAYKGLYAIIVSPSRVFGPCENFHYNVINHRIKQILHHPFVLVPADKNVMNNYVFIDDVVQGHFMAIDKGLGGETYLLGGENISYNKFFETIRQAAQTKVKFIPVPKSLLNYSAFLYSASCKLVGKHTQFTPSTVKRFLQSRTLNCKKATTQLGYSITSFEEGVTKTINYLKGKTYA